MNLVGRAAVALEDEQKTSRLRVSLDLRVQLRQERMEQHRTCGGQTQATQKIAAAEKSGFGQGRSMRGSLFHGNGFQFFEIGFERWMKESETSSSRIAALRLPWSW